MRRKNLFCIIFALLLLVTSARAGYSDLPEVDVQARSAILVDGKTGELLYTRSIHIQRPPASITKVMTTFLALEFIANEPERLNDIVTAEKGDFFDMVSDGSTANIKEGEELTLEQLLYCAMVVSANESCNIIARYVAGSVPDFVELMNARAKELGCENTNFANTHGLPHAEHYSSAYDIYLIVREAMKIPLFMELAHTEVYTIPPTNKTPEGRSLITTNNLITKRRSAEYIYAYARGIKTGSTGEAGYCLVSSAEKDGMVLISVVLGAARDEETNLARSFTETRDLFEWGFNNFTTKRLLGKNEPVSSVKVLQGVDADEVILVPQQVIEALVPVSLNPEDIKREVTLYETEITAPVYRGRELGEVTLTFEGHNYGTVPLVANFAIERSTTDQIKSNITEIIDDISLWSWLPWVIGAVVGFTLLYFVIVIVMNLRRRARRRPAPNYKGRKRRR